MSTPASLTSEISNAIQRNAIVSLNLDFDGTLGPHVPNPFDARATKEALEAVLTFLRVEKDLKAQGENGLGRVEVSIITGRQFSTLPEGMMLDSDAVKANPIRYANGVKELLLQSVHDHLPAEEHAEAEALIAGLSCDHFHGMFTRPRNGDERGPAMDEQDHKFISTLQTQLTDLYDKYKNAGYDFTACREQSPLGEVVNYRAFIEGESKSLGSDAPKQKVFESFRKEAKELLSSMAASAENDEVRRPASDAPVKRFAIHSEALSDEIRINGFGHKGSAIKARYEDTRQRWPGREVVLVWAGDSLRNQKGQNGTDYPAFKEVNAIPEGRGVGIQVLDKQKGAGSTQVPLENDPASPKMIFEAPDQFGKDLLSAATAYKHMIRQMVGASPATIASDARLALGEKRVPEGRYY